MCVVLYWPLWFWWSILRWGEARQCVEHHKGQMKHKAAHGRAGHYGKISPFLNPRFLPHFPVKKSRVGAVRTGRGAGGHLDTAGLTGFRCSYGEARDWLVFTGHNKAFDVARILFTHPEHQHLMRPDTSLFRSGEYFRLRKLCSTVQKDHVRGQRFVVTCVFQGIYLSYVFVK